MSKISVYLMIFACVFFLLAVAYYSFKNWRAEIRKNKELRQVIDEQNENMKFLLKHAEELKKIEKEENITQKQIEEAETDEEIFFIIDAIVSHNNRLCDE